MSDQPTHASGSQAGLIDAAWQQVAGLARPTGGSSERAGTFAGRQPTTLPHDAFPGYRLIGEIHRGGQGVVYKALQESTERNVAIKVLRDGHLLTATDIARFEQEVRVLGRLRHANIVRIFDSSAAEGRFYYVMDYIPGLPLDAHVRQSLPSLSSADDIVRLFVKICDAVNAAHLRGIIHRDLKPGNVRVDREGEPFVLDFGLSKLADDAGSDVTLSGQFVGSIPWASPEQAEARIDAIDIRTDVYSLGVLLYQMLTSEFPYRMDGRPHELLAQIIKAEPTPPRTYVANLSLDLETIILKCLQKDPDRRYQSAGELGRDLARYLAREPIEARRDSYTYVLAKQLARYRLVAIGCAAFLVVLVAGLVASLTFWQQAEAARQTAETERNNAQKQERLAVSANAFLNDMLSRADRGEQGGDPDVRVRDVLDEAARLLLTNSDDDEPEVRENLLGTVGKTYDALGLYDEAERHLRAALDSRRVRLATDDADMAYRLLHLAAVLRNKGDLAESERLADEALQLRRRLLGENDPLVGTALAELAKTRFIQEDLTGAETYYRQALDLWSARPPDDPTLIPALQSSFALVCQARGDRDGAEDLYRKAQATLRQIHGDEHPSIAAVLNNLASVLDLKGDADGAEESYRAALAMRRKLLGEEHPLVALTLNNLAGFLLNTRRDPAAAEPLYREALALRRKALGETHRDTISGIANLAVALHDLRKLDEAETLYQQAIDLHRQAFGDQDLDLAAKLGNFAMFHVDRGDLGAAERLFREAVEIWRGQGDPHHPSMATQVGSLGAVLAMKGDFDAAEECFREALAIRLFLSGDRPHPDVAVARANLGALFTAREAFAEAEPELRAALQQMRIQPGPTHPTTLNCMANLGWTLSELAWQRRATQGEEADHCAAEAAELLREVLETRTAQLPPGDSALGQCRSLLGGALLAGAAVDCGSATAAAGDCPEQLAEIEALLQSGYEALEVAVAAKPSPSGYRNLARAAERVVRLCELWDMIDPRAGRADEAAPWRLRADEWRAAAQPAQR